jgi:hypothetical protein
VTITAVQETGARGDSTTAIPKAFTSNVSSGNLIVLAGWKITLGASDPFVAGDCTKSAGTATVGAITLDKAVEIDDGGGDRIAVGVWSCLVTGAGSCTMQMGGMAAGSYGGIGIGEYASDVGWDAGRLETSISSSTATDNQTSALSGNMTSAGKALFIGGVSIPSSGAVTITPDAAFAQLFEEEDGTLHQPGSTIRRIVAAGTTDSVDWAMVGNNAGDCVAAAVYKEAAGGAAGAIRLLFPSPLTGIGSGGPFLGDRLQ